MLNITSVKPWRLYFIILLVVLIGSLFIPVDSAFPPRLVVQDPAKATLDLIDGIVKLLTSVNTVMLAAAAALTIKGRDWTSAWSGLDSFLILLVFTSGGVSYFGVYFCYMRVLTMVNQSALYPLESGLIWSLRLQYFGLIFGVSLLGLVFSRIIEGRIPSPLATSEKK